MCEEAVTTLLKNAEDSKCSATMKFDAGISREIIGPGGSQIQKMQEASGAKINVDSKSMPWPRPLGSSGAPLAQPTTGKEGRAGG